MTRPQADTFGTRSDLVVRGTSYSYYSLEKLAEKFPGVSRLPYSIKILLECLLRNEDGSTYLPQHIEDVAQWDPAAQPRREIPFMPARVLLQDFTGVPALVDLAAMRDAVVGAGGNPEKINPLLPSELVIDHSVQVDAFGAASALQINSEKDYERNRERYAFLRWGQKAFDNFRVVPPDTGIVHQVNVEYLARGVFRKKTAAGWTAYPDTLVGTDSHTTMVNGLGVLGWGVGGIEAEAAMLGQPISLLVPQVVGFELTGKLAEGATSTDLVLTVTRILREKSVVGKFVEFHGDGLDNLTLADRATLGNMSPEYGATCAIFPMDQEMVSYMKFTGRDADQVALVEDYARSQGLFRTSESPRAIYSSEVSLDLGSIVPAISGPKRPQDMILLTESRAKFLEALPVLAAGRTGGKASAPDMNGLKDGSVVIAAITSCTNTSNPSVMMGAGLMARNAVEKGLNTMPWVKTSFAPGSKVVTEYLKEAGLMAPLEALRFHLVGYGCTTCIGNSGPLPDKIAASIKDNDLVAVSVLSGNRNFEGRIHPLVKANYLASPPLVVAYALAGRMDIDFQSEPLGTDKNGADVFLRDIWPSSRDVQSAVRDSVTTDQFTAQYKNVFLGDDRWQALPIPEGTRFEWSEDSTYVQLPTFLKDVPRTPAEPKDIRDARVLVMLGDSVTTDHISPAGAIPAGSPAGDYLESRGVPPAEFNSFGSRRGNHEVMVRGTFGNIRLRNQLAPGTEGGVTRHFPDGEQTTIYEASRRYADEGVPLIALGGKEYGSGSSRDWAAKGPALLGLRAVIAESYERIHRSNLVGMGILPLQFMLGENRVSLGLTGEEKFSIKGIAGGMETGKTLDLIATDSDGASKAFKALARIDTPVELEYYRHGGILLYVLRQLI